MAILEMQKLTRRFGALTAVDALTISVEPGEVFGLLGPNGAGKTTTLKVLTTLRPPGECPLALLGVMLIVFLGAGFFSVFSLIIDSLVKTRERFMGIGQVLTMPLFFASNAIYPISIIPGWLQVISHINPLTYEVAALRALMLAGGMSLYSIGVDVSILVAAMTILVVIGARLYPDVAIQQVSERNEGVKQQDPAVEP